jgi:Phage integrase, N-terminal SAM-like domain/Arm DNA-binding domain
MRGFVRKRGSTYTWYFDVPDPVTGKRRQYSKGGFRTKKECQQALNEALSALRTGTFVEPSQRTVAGFLVKEWLPAMRPPRVRPSTWLSYRKNVERHIVPALGHLPLQRLTPAQLTALYRELLETGHRKGKPRPSPEDRPQHSWRPACRAPGRGAVGVCRPQRRGGGRSPEEHDPGDAGVEPAAAPHLP